MADSSWIEAWPAVPVVLFALYGVWAKWDDYRTTRRRRDLLHAYGASRGLQPGSFGMAWHSVPAVQGMLHGVAVMVVCAVQDKRPSTMVRAAALHLAGTVHVSRGTGTFEKALGLQDVKIGDPLFDPWFVIKSDPPERAAQWLTPWLRREVMAFGVEDLRLSLTDGTVVVSWPGVHVEDFAVLDQAVRIALTAALGRTP